MRRALVTGCAGFIGSHLTEALLGEGVSVIGVDCFNDNYQRPPKLRNLSHQAKDWEGFEFVPVDLSRGELDDLVADCDVVFHLAAEPGVRSSWGERFGRYVANNVIATQHLLDALTRSGDVRLVYASSSSVYGDAEALPTAESVVPRPRSPYGVTKLAAEHLCQAYTADYGLPTVTLRYFSVYGPRQRPDMAFHRFLEAGLTGRTVQVFGDGLQTRDFTYVGDVVAATLAAAGRELPPGAVYNIGGGARTSVREVLGLIGSLLGRDLEVGYSSEEPGDVRDTSADTTLARSDLDFEPATPLKEGIAAQLEWTRALLEASPVARS